MAIKSIFSLLLFSIAAVMAQESPPADKEEARSPKATRYHTQGKRKKNKQKTQTQARNRKRETRELENLKAGKSLEPDKDTPPAPSPSEGEMEVCPGNIPSLLS